MAVASPVEGDLPRWVSSTGARHLAWRASRSPGPIAAAEALRLRKLIRSVDPDLIHLHSAKAGLAGRLAIRGKHPTVHQPHAWSFLAVEGTVARGALAWERFASRWTHLTICVSESERVQGRAAGIRSITRVIPNGVDLDVFRPEDRFEARAKLGLGEEPLVVCVGRLSRQKGQDVLLKAWRRISPDVPEARLVLVGGGPDEAALRAAASKGVVFAGMTTKVPLWLTAADVIALPSRWEGMSLTMLEGMAAGRSVIISDVPGAREAVRAGAGAVVPVEDPVALSEALIERLTDPLLTEAEGREARRLAEELFGLERSLKATQDAYESVLDPGR